MATAWRSALRFREPWPLHHPHYRCYYQLPLVMLCWLIIILASFLVEGTGVEGRVSSKGCLQGERDALLHYKAAIRDPSDRLSSWQEAQGDDCCSWTGVVCYNVTERAAYNDFEGSQIPPLVGSLHELSTMISTLVEPLPSFGFDEMAILETMPVSSGSESITLDTKGSQLTYSSILYLVKSIDLSNNELTNEIPEELGYLAGLQTLNLSRNYFKGKILDSIGGMSSLETLDLSFNNLSGVIPQGVSQLNALNHLNLSYNNLSGNIPYGNQL
ncbi:leucine-rich repeat receptor-like serine/threonine-protein kinase SKM1 [Zingiber officinale]|uniref:leucine-rich repeat receptor-like serine/threonine-protein kinase SKM1 n=1 Tax=Zingiber officinale TaxID=94328 RepID=UPI001C4B1221|nr:leucine-rich repeat receptor-like serine/threonine-protein kinase SKM1 [Zingiber officinale]